jgi:hypothetical protein
MESPLEFKHLRVIASDVLVQDQAVFASVKWLPARSDDERT